LLGRSLGPAGEIAGHFGMTQLTFYSGIGVDDVGDQPIIDGTYRKLLQGVIPKRPAFLQAGPRDLPIFVCGGSPSEAQEWSL